METSDKNSDYSLSSRLSQEAKAYRAVRRFVTFVVGTTVLIIGIVMLVLPGPGVAGVLAGLAILGTEFVWARRILKLAKEKLQNAYEAATAKSTSKQSDSE